MKTENDRAARRRRVLAIFAAVIAVAAYHAAVSLIPVAICCASGAAAKSAVGAAVRLVCAGALIVLWKRAKLSTLASKGDERFFRPVRGAYIALCALCGALLQIVCACAVTLVLSAGQAGARFDFSSAEAWTAMIAAVAVTPLCEETVFRGAALRLMRSASPFVVSALVTSILFGLIHNDALTAAIACYVGFLLAALSEKKGSLFPALALHASFNLTSFFCGYITIPPAIALAVSAPPAAVCIIFLLKGKKNETL